MGSKVTLIRNYLNISLFNGLIGIVKEIAYEYGKVVSNLLKFVLMNFGISYVGNSFFNNNLKCMWFLIFPIKNISYTMNRNSTNRFTKYSQIILPL